MRIHRHNRNGKKYLSVKSTKIRIESTGEWVDGVIYICLYLNREGMVWVRTKQDFDLNFSPARGRYLR